MTVNFPGINQTGIKQSFPGNSPANNKIYSSFYQMNQSLLKYGDEQEKVYASQFSSMKNGGKISVDELKETIKKEFPVYKMVSNEPADVMDGQNLLYIDKNNLQKMAEEADYRAKVFGLMRREGDSSTGTTNVRLNGEVHSFTTTGSVFSLSDKNESVDGIPYKGSAKSMSMSSTTMSTSNSRSTGKNEDWYEKMLKEIKKRKEEKEARLEEIEERNKMKNGEGEGINFYL